MTLLTTTLPGAPVGRLTALTPLVGRETDITAAGELLSSPESHKVAVPSAPVRLLTLTGPGGVGKTRLAVAVAENLTFEYPDGIAWVDLSAADTAAAVAPAIARALGLRQEGPYPPLDRVKSSIGQRRILLILDNFEHVLAAAPMVVDLLRTCPRLAILVTSRERLHVNGEHEQPVSPLPLPMADSSAEAVLCTPAVQLFVDRARAIAPGLPLDGDATLVVAEICRRLDGLPLAIELAASRIKVLLPAELLDRLDQQLKLLTDGARDAPTRQRTIRDAIAWSYNLLTPEEQSLFRRLAVFVDGFTLEAAEAVGMRHEAEGKSPRDTTDEVPPLILDLVTALVEKSLLVVHHEAAGGTRYGMLEIMREFGLERLAASGELEDTRRAHAVTALALAERIEPELYGGRNLMRCLDLLEGEHPNLRAALTWLGTAGEHELALRLATALIRFWFVRGPLSESREWLERTLDAAVTAPSPLRAKALTGLAMLSWTQGDGGRAAAAIDAALAIIDRVADVPGLAFARLAEAYLALNQRDFALAAERAIESKTLYGQAGRRWDQCSADFCLAGAAFGQGDLRRAEALYEALISAVQGLGDDYGLATARHGLGLVRAAQGDHVQALELQGSALLGYQALGERMWVAACLEAAATAAGDMGEAARAAQLLGVTETLRTHIGLPTWFSDRATIKSTSVAARRALGEEAFAAECAEGATITLDEAMAMVDAIVRMASAAPRPDNEAETPFGLSLREIEVLRLMAQGKTDQETAEALFVSRRTVHTHVASILNKLAAENRTAAVATAVRLGLA